MEKTVYIALRDADIPYGAKRCILSDFADIVCPEELSDIKKLPFDIEGGMTITAADVARAAANADFCCTLSFIGDKDAAVDILRQPEKKWLHLLKVTAVSLLLFFGAVSTLLNFHNDVDMPGVHRGIAEFLGTDSIIINIAYTVGLSAGICVFLIRPRIRGKKRGPSPMELSMYEYGKKLRNYRSGD